jgi:hypothetical protein
MPGAPGQPDTDGGLLADSEGRKIAEPADEPAHAAVTDSLTCHTLSSASYELSAGPVVITHHE